MFCLCVRTPRIYALLCILMYLQSAMRAKCGCWFDAPQHLRFHLADLWPERRPPAINAYLRNRRDSAQCANRFASPIVKCWNVGDVVRCAHNSVSSHTRTHNQRTQLNARRRPQNGASCDDAAKYGALGKLVIFIMVIFNALERHTHQREHASHFTRVCSTLCARALRPNLC